MGREHTDRIHPDPLRPWYTVKSLAYELRVCEKTIRRQIERGALTAHHIGREVRISPQSRQEFLDSIVLKPGQYELPLGGLRYYQKGKNALFGVAPA